MVTEKLIINGVDIPLINGIGTVLNYSIKDIEQPDKRKASFSKTIKLPHSKVTSDLFNFIFEINSDSTFNTRIKTPAIYLINDIAVFKGILQLKKVNKLDNEHYTYDVVLLGELANLFTDIGDGYINDADMLWNNLDHVYQKSEIKNSWDTSYIFNGSSTPFQIGSGYTYPMISYDNDSDKEEWFTVDFKPAIFVKEYIDRMFSAAGFEYNSAFFDSDYFKRLIIPYTGKGFVKRDIDLLDLTSRYDTGLFNSTGTDAITTTTINGVTSTNGGNYDPVRFTNLIQDNNSQYNPATGQYTSSYWGGVYQVALFNIVIDLSSGAAVFCDMTSTFVIEMSFYKNGVIVGQDKAFIKLDNPLSTTGYTTANPAIFEDPDFKTNIYDLSLMPDSALSRFANPNNSVNNYAVTMPAIFANNTTDVLEFKVRGTFIPDTGSTKNFTDSLGVEYDGSATINLLPSSYIYYYPANSFNLQDVVDMFTVIPDKIKKRDFFKSIVEMFNLYVEPDTDNPKKLTIEPRDEFYSSTVADWSGKLDVSKEIQYDTLSGNGYTKYSYAYKSDKDYYNKLYEDTWQTTYGNREIDIIDDFSKKEYKQSIIFSPTPSVGSSINDRVIPSMIGVDKDLQPISTNTNIRILQYTGLIPCNAVWDFKEFTASLSDYQTTYPYCGHFYPDAFNPTEDINFGLPKEIYWDATFNTITVTNNNLYNKYHKKELEEQTDKDSKLVTAWFLLNPTDIYNLDFKVQYFFDNAYFRLQEVKYKPNSYEVSECKFLKLKTGASFTPTTVQILGGDGEIAGEKLPFIADPYIQSDGNLLIEKSGNVVGSNNIVSASVKNYSIQGDGNTITSNSKNITIKGDNNLIESNLENITLINTSNVTVTESNITYINGEIKGTGSVVTITTNTTADEKITTYLCDTSGGTIAISLPDFPTVGKVWNFKKIAINNTLQIRVNAPNSIDGQLVKNITALNNSYTLQFDGSTYKII